MNVLPETHPRILVLSSLFPSEAQPGAGMFVRERMFRVGKVLPLTVVAPTPWFPLQGLIRIWRPQFRPRVPHRERQGEFEVRYPRFLSLPGVLKSLDGFSMALCALPAVWRLKRGGRVDLIDAHFGYPDGYAATLLGRWLELPVTITLRGTETRHARDGRLRPLLAKALRRAARIFAVSASLKDLAVTLGIEAERIRVVGNGVDTARFFPVDRSLARKGLGIEPNARVLISVGGLVERKGFHRVIDCLPALRRKYPDLVYLVVGGPSPEGDWTARLKDQVSRLGLQECLRFLGQKSPDELRVPLSAADVFVLATRNEGWANVFLEAMACGLPVVATDVGGNREVVSAVNLGTIVPFDDVQALIGALDDALARRWDRTIIRKHAENNAWDDRVGTLVDEFKSLHAARSNGPPREAAEKSAADRMRA